MPSNRAYLDPDVVRPTKYIVPPSWLQVAPWIFANIKGGLESRAAQRLCCATLKRWLP